MVRRGSKDASRVLATGQELPAEILPLIGERVVVLHGPSLEDAHLSGSDIDCGVIGLDPQWPLRMPADWRLCQYLQYDLNGWFWAIERQGQVINLDTLDDIHGLGRDALRTGMLEGEELHPSPSLHAAYLTAKRVRKGMSEPEEWARISTLAGQDPDGYARTLKQVVGPASSQGLAEAVLAGSQPGPRLVSRVRRERFMRRFGSPGRSAVAVGVGARRRLHRLISPTGSFVLLVGPDGTGKSTLAQVLPSLVEGTFRRTRAFHWRPDILPRPGRLLGRKGADPQAPHARPAYGPIMSSALLGYYWLDFFLGGWLHIWPLRARTGMIIVERGWWDVAVDPLRYRLTSPPGMVRALGFLLPRPDLVLLLEAPSRVILERKSEISEEELDRQTSAWDSVLPANVPVVHLDASRPADRGEGRSTRTGSPDAGTTGDLPPRGGLVRDPKPPYSQVDRPPGSQGDRCVWFAGLPPCHHSRAARLGGCSLVRGDGCCSTSPQDGPAPAFRPTDPRSSHPETGHAGRGEGQSPGSVCRSDP